MLHRIPTYKDCDNLNMKIWEDPLRTIDDQLEDRKSNLPSTDSTARYVYKNRPDKYNVIIKNAAVKRSKRKNKTVPKSEDQCQKKA